MNEAISNTIIIAIAFLSFNGLNIPVLSGGFNGKISYNWWIFHCHHYCSMDWKYWKLSQKTMNQAISKHIIILPNVNRLVYWNVYG
jgi:hypothetical protein